MPSFNILIGAKMLFLWTKTLSVFWPTQLRWLKWRSKVLSFAISFIHIIFALRPLHRSLPEVQGLDLSSERKESKIVLESGQQTRIPACQEYQVHKLGWVQDLRNNRGEQKNKEQLIVWTSATKIWFRLAADQSRDVEGWITTGGELITTRYEADFQHGQVMTKMFSNILLAW